MTIELVALLVGIAQLVVAVITLIDSRQREK